MTYTDHKAEARKYSATAAAATRRAEREAHQAQDSYETAERVARQAAWLTGRSDLWDLDWTPAELESRVRSWVKMGDVYLRSSFHATSQADFYKDLAARYREMAERHALQVAV